MNLLARYDHTMSSREIASATGKRHDHVLRDIRAMLDELEIDSPDLGSEFIADNGHTYTEYHLNRDLTLTLVSGYSAKLRHAIILRMRYLETELLDQQMTEHASIVFERRSNDIYDRHRAELKAKNAEIQALEDQMRGLLDD